MRLKALAILIVASAVLTGSGVIACAISPSFALGWLMLFAGVVLLIVNGVRFGNEWDRRQTLKEVREIRKIAAVPGIHRSLSAG